MPANRKVKGFFSVDRGAFRCAAAGGLNSAIAYLIMVEAPAPTTTPRNGVPTRLKNTRVYRGLVPRGQ